MKAGRSLRSLTGRAAGSVIATLLLSLAIVAAVSSAAPRVRSSLEIETPSALVAQMISVERATLAIGAPSTERRAPHARWSVGALAGSEFASVSPARVRDALLQRPRALVPRALRRTYDAHAPPSAIDRV